MRILAISGSLRASSSNTRLLQAAILLAPEGMQIDLFSGLDDLPHFNPDREEEEIVAVRTYRELLQAADGVLISTPEYAHGLPGVLKNALDWVVGSGEFIDKPVALLNASAASTYAQASLTETLTVMMGRIIPEATVTVPMRGKTLTPEEIAAHPEIGPTVRNALSAFATAIAASNHS